MEFLFFSLFKLSELYLLSFDSRSANSSIWLYISLKLLRKSLNSMLLERYSKVAVLSDFSWMRIWSSSSWFALRRDSLIDENNSVRCFLNFFTYSERFSLSSYWSSMTFSFLMYKKYFYHYFLRSSSWTFLTKFSISALISTFWIL